MLEVTDKPFQCAAPVVEFEIGFIGVVMELPVVLLCS
jgi:hypothetical protein